ncbi:hypothetical protein F6B50_18865, partial [Salmonella enterica]|nr:hypothetical protein [Salmonella enterica]ECX3817811.1 hypothetical protein [Salmonella enterica]
ININITLYSFELIFYDGFDVYLLLIFTVIVLSLMMSASNGWQGNITKLFLPELLGQLLLRKKK